MNRAPSPLDFREHLATADKDGRRRWLFAKKPAGRFYRWRTCLSWLLLGMLFAGPFIRINGNPALLLNIVERRFSILGRVFWPQDMAIFAVAMLLFLMEIMVFTTAFGRIWCGWTCPHTLFQEMVFRKIEFAIEGDAAQQRALKAAPWSGRKFLIKGFKHGVFLGIALVVANLLLCYIIGPAQLWAIVTDDPRRHLAGLGAMLGFTALFYSIFAHFREQACTFICPYGRFQSAVLDENSLVIAYDHKRGEQRAPSHRGDKPAARQAAGQGDCVDCRLCVAVCPTGIDIRNGTQMECVNCTACIDACDGVMDKLEKPRGLIRYASLNSIERGERFRFTPRLAAYCAVLAALVATLLFLVFSRSDVETTVLRAPGALFQEVEGEIQNLYTVKVINKTSRQIAVQFTIENVPGSLQIMGGGKLIVAPEELAQAPVLIRLGHAALAGHRTPLTIGVYSGGERLETVNTVFIGPRDN